MGAEVPLKKNWVPPSFLGSTVDRGPATKDCHSNKKWESDRNVGTWDRLLAPLARVSDPILGRDSSFHYRNPRDVTGGRKRVKSQYHFLRLVLG